MKTSITHKWRSQIVGGVLLLVLAGCSSKQESATAVKAEAPIAVSVAMPSGGGETGINLTGTIEASQTVNISTRVMGFITMLRVKAGDHVSKGQLLATIGNDDILARRAQADAMIADAEATLRNAQKDLDRFTVLYNQQSATAKELENVSLQHSAARSRLEAAKQMRNEITASLGYTRLTAPFAGVVTQKLAEAGSMASPGMPLLTIEQGGNYQVNASVPENIIHNIHRGAIARVTVKALDKTISGAVTQVNPSSQFTGSQYMIKIAIPVKENEGLYSGMYANVFIPVQGLIPAGASGNPIMVPLSSIERKDQLTGLYTIATDNTALLRWVRLGKTYGDKVEVLTGLEKNEQFIVNADGKLYNGVPVKLQ